MDKSRKLYGLQYLRAIAASAVVAFHAAGRIGYSFTVGEGGVDLFFVLSGFLMVAITSPTTAPSSFLADRVRRIAPMYWLVTTAIVVGTLVGMFPSVILSADYVLACYLFLPSISPANLQTWPLLVPGWTLNFEMMFYVVFAATLPMRSQIRQLAVLTVAFSALTAFGIFAHPRQTALRFYADPLLMEFAAGGWLAIAWKHVAHWPRGIMWPATVIGLGGFLAAGILDPPIVRTLLYGIPAIFLVAGVLAIEKRRPIGRWRSPLLIGDASYSIYLWHTLVISAVIRPLAQLVSGSSTIVTFLILLFTGIFGGVAGHVLIERPLLNRMRASRRRPGVQEPARS